METRLLNNRKYIKPKLSTFVLFLFLLCSNSIVFSQELPEYKNQIKFSPLRLLNNLNPGLELGYEREYDKYSSQVSVAYLFDFFPITEYKNYSGHRIMLEQKYFIFKRKYVRQYFSLGMGYYSASMIASSLFMPKDIERGDILYYDSQYEDTFKLKRIGVPIDAKYGIQLLIDRSIIEFSVGFGFIIHNITHSNRMNPNDKMVNDHFNVYYMMEKEGKHVMPNLPLTLKLSYAF